MATDRTDLHRPRVRWADLVPFGWATALALLMLGPALAPGFVLSYDMVWVPDLALRPDALGLGSGLPRAVPSDAVVAVVDEVVPGMVLQKLVLLTALAGAGAGVAVLLGEASLGARLVGVSVVTWNPYVVERLLIGHWPVLLAYAALPWLVLQVRRARSEGRPPGLWWVLVPLASLSASAGMLTALVVLALTLPAARSSPRLLLLTAAGLVAANAPWVVAGVLHASDAVTDPAGAALFALDGVALLPAPLAALGLGGIWNGEVVLPSRDTLAAPVALLVLMSLAVAGLRRWGRSVGREERWGLLGVAAVGWLLAVLTSLAPDLVGTFGAAVPGAGLLRDGARQLALLALPMALLAAHGADAVAARFPSGVARTVALLSMAVLPVTFLPDAAFGAAGRLAAVAYPDSFEEVRSEVATHRAEGDVLVLPFASYRAPDFNGGRKVLDPMGRYLARDVVVSDRLWVDGRLVEGEDPRAVEVGEALAAPTAEERASRLAALGVGSVVVDLEQSAVAPSASAPEVAGRTTRVDGFEVVRLEQAVTVSETPTGWPWAMAAAWAAYAGTLVLAIVLLVLRRTRK